METPKSRMGPGRLCVTGCSAERMESIFDKEQLIVCGLDDVRESIGRVAHFCYGAWWLWRARTKGTRLSDFWNFAVQNNARSETPSSICRLS